MPKGIQKRIIVIKTEKESGFESAFFIMRPDRAPEKSDDAMLFEAQSIIAENERAKRKKRSKTSSFGTCLLTLVIGILCGSALVGTLWIFIG